MWGPFSLPSCKSASDLSTESFSNMGLCFMCAPWKQPWPNINFYTASSLVFLIASWERMWRAAKPQVTMVPARLARSFLAAWEKWDNAHSLITFNHQGLKKELCGKGIHKFHATYNTLCLPPNFAYTIFSDYALGNEQSSQEKFKTVLVVYVNLGGKQNVLSCGYTSNFFNGDVIFRKSRYQCTMKIACVARF